MSRIVSQDPMIARAAAIEQQKMQQAAAINQVVVTTAANIYGHLAAMELFGLEEWNAEEIVPRLRTRAQQAKEAALLLAESYGMVKITERHAVSEPPADGV